MHRVSGSLLHAFGDQFPGVAATFLYVLVRLSVLDPMTSGSLFGADIRSSCHVVIEAGFDPEAYRFMFIKQVASRVRCHRGSLPCELHWQLVARHLMALCTHFAFTLSRHLSKAVV